VNLTVAPSAARTATSLTDALNDESYGHDHPFPNDETDVDNEE
jgi:hypothetical protein